MLGNMPQGATIFGGRSDEEEGGGRLVGGHICNSLLAMASALRMLQMGMQALPMEEARLATGHLFIANPLTAGRMLQLFSTHPPMDERIVRLERQALGGVKSPQSGG